MKLISTKTKRENNYQQTFNCAAKYRGVRPSIWRALMFALCFNKTCSVVERELACYWHVSMRELETIILLLTAWTQPMCFCLSKNLESVRSALHGSIVRRCHLTWGTAQKIKHVSIVFILYPDHTGTKKINKMHRPQIDVCMVLLQKCFLDMGVTVHACQHECSSLLSITPLVNINFGIENQAHGFFFALCKRSYK